MPLLKCLLLLKRLLGLSLCRCWWPQVGSVSFDRQGVANHATQLANTIQGNLKRSLEAIGVVSCA